MFLWILTIIAIITASVITTGVILANEMSDASGVGFQGKWIIVGVWTVAVLLLGWAIVG